MICIVLGIIAFFFFIIYDINSIIMKNKLLDCCFFAGFLLLGAATIGILIDSWDIININILRTGICGILAILSFFLLIYTLFFALPFKNTYIQTESPLKVCQSGVYALCRHPGVIWFTGFYAFLGLALMSQLLLIAAAIFSVLNFIYILFQDRWTFVKTFEDYDSYKIDTPFLLPNLKSIKRCIQTL